MAKAAVVYKSTYGGTKKYAMHIAEKTGADLYVLKKNFEFDFDKYDIVALGGGLYAGKVNGMDFITKNADKLVGKTIAVFTCGFGDPTVTASAQAISKSVAKALPDKLKNSVHLYCFRSGLDYTQLGFKHKMMMSMMNKMLQKKKPEERTADDKELLANYGGKIDLTDFSTAQPIIDYINAAKA